MDKEIEVNDVVYQKKRGWSGVPMKVLEIDDKVALCKGTQGWSLNGLLSEKHDARVSRYALARLTHTPDSMLGK